MTFHSCGDLGGPAFNPAPCQREALCQSGSWHTASRMGGALCGLAQLILYRDGKYCSKFIWGQSGKQWEFICIQKDRRLLKNRVGSKSKLPWEQRHLLKPSHGIPYSNPFSFPVNTSCRTSLRQAHGARLILPVKYSIRFPWVVEVTHGYIIMVKLLSEQLVFAKVDCASTLKHSLSHNI